MGERMGGDQQLSVSPHGSAVDAAGQDHVQGVKEPLPLALISTIFSPRKDDKCSDVFVGDEQGWLRYFSERRGSTFQPVGSRVFFVLRGRWLVLYESSLMEDSGENPHLFSSSISPKGRREKLREREGEGGRYREGGRKRKR